MKHLFLGMACALSAGSWGQDGTAIRVVIQHDPDTMSGGRWLCLTILTAFAPTFRDGTGID